MGKSSEIIANIIREELMSETLTDVYSNVDMLYNLYFKVDYEKVDSTRTITVGMFKKSMTDTGILKSPSASKAHKINPCKIVINYGGNHYAPKNMLISLSANLGAVEFIKDEGNGNLDTALEFTFDDNLSKSLLREFKESSIKGSIHHELAHWIDDTEHNKHIYNRVLKAKETGTPIAKKNIPIFVDKMEIQGQIHNISQLKQKYPEKWNDMSFNEMVAFSPSLSNIFHSLQNGDLAQWIKVIKTRMFREGLLGKSMTN